VVFWQASFSAFGVFFFVVASGSVGFFFFRQTRGNGPIAAA
jgi:hypothetical protein